MNAYVALFTARAQLLFQYRAAMLAGLATQLFWGYVRIMVFTAFYSHATLTSQLPISLQDTITYVWLGQMLFSLLPWNIDREVDQLVRSGNIVYELVKPLNLYGYWYARALAMRLIPTMLKAFPVLLIAWMFLGLSAPPSLTHAGLFAVGLVGALLLSAAITTLVMFSLFWTVNSEGITRLLPVVVLVFSGMLIPLPLFPSWMQPLIEFLPLRGMLDTPFRLYSGFVTPQEALGLFLHQWIWLAVLIFWGYRLMHRATHRLVVQGG